MPSAYKQSKKEIAEPDQFLKASNEYLNKAAANKTKIIAAAGGFLVLALIVAALSGFSESKRQKSGEAFSAAIEISRRPVSDAIGAEDVQAFASDKAKYEAVAAAFQKVREEHSGTAAAVSAAYYLADADFHLEKYDEAASLFGEYISKAGKDAPMYLQALEGQAYTAEAKKDYAKAEALFRQLSETSKGDAMKGRALFNAARQLELLGKKDEAANAYAKIDADFATKAFEVSRTARDRLALLAAQGIKPVKSGDTAPEAAK